MSIYSESKSLSVSRINSRAREIAEKAAQQVSSIGGMFPQQQALFGQSDIRNQRAYGYYRGWVYTCIHPAARRVAAQPWGCGLMGGSRSADKRLVGGTQLKRLRQLGCVKQASSELEVVESHPLLDLLERPNSVQRKWDFLYLSAVNMLLTGECYWVASGGEDDNEELWCVPTHWIRPRHDNGLFTGFTLSIDSMVRVELSSEQVARTYMPSPYDVRQAMSPLQAIIQSVQVDDSIVTSQKQLFDRGIFPNLVVTVGRNIGPDGKRTDTRPALTMPQRSQMIRAIRQIWSQSVNAGDPAIIDGFIESIHKITNSPQEMDWLQSSELVRKRIMQAFGLNPIIVGELENANRASAVVAEQSVCANVVNPLVAAFSETAQEFFSQRYPESEKLVVWLEPAEPVDPDLELARWTAARQVGDVTPNEFRAEILGLPPLEEDEGQHRNQLLDSAAGMQAAIQVTSAIAMGAISQESGASLLQLFLQITEQEADAIVGSGKLEGAMAPQQQPVPEETAARLIAGKGNQQRVGYRPSLSRDAIKAASRKQTEAVQQILAKAAGDHFSQCVAGTTKAIRESDIDTQGESPEIAAERLLAAAYDPQEWLAEMKKTLRPPLTWAAMQGAMSELNLMARLGGKAVKRDQPRVPAGGPDGGQFTSGGGGGGSSGSGGAVAEQQSSEQSARAKASYNPCTKEKQQESDRFEAELARKIGAKRSGDNKPMDNFVDTVHGVEVKVLHDAKTTRVHMRRDSRERKEAWIAERKGRTGHTVLIDNRDKFGGGKHKDRYSGHKIYYHQGVGAFRGNKMTKVKNYSDLKKLIKGDRQTLERYGL